MDNVIQFKSAKDLAVEAIQGLTLYDLFEVMQAQRGYGKITIFAENELGDVEVISNTLEDAIELLERFYCQNERNGL